MTDPTYSGVGVAIAAGRLARDLGIPAVHLVVNRVRSAADEARVRMVLAARGDGLAFDSHTWLPDDPAVLDAEPSVQPLLAAPDSPFLAAVRALLATVAPQPAEAAP
ncbi:MAG: hypothetical protein WEC14_00565 [Chloroflexota bacterium]